MASRESTATPPKRDGTSTEPDGNQLVTGARSDSHTPFRGWGREPLSEPLEHPSIVVTLPWKVLVADNQRHGLMRGRILLTEKYRTALGAASILAATQWRRPALKGSVALELTLFEPDKRRRDISNYLKIVQDTLTRVCFVDDSQVDHVTVIRGALDRFNPRAEIRVEARDA